MDSDVVMKNRSNMNDEGDEGEANSELEARLYAEIYYSNEIPDKVSPPQEQYSMTTINNVKSHWRNIADIDQGFKTNNPITSSEKSQNIVDKLQPALGESSNRCHNIEVSQVDENNGNFKQTNSDNINKKVNSKKGQTPKKKKSQNMESVTNESQEESDVPSLSKASQKTNEQVHEIQLECQSATSIINNDNTGTIINQANKRPRSKKSKICQNDPVTPSKQKSHNNKQQLIEEDSVTRKISENERIISGNPARSNPSSLLNVLEQATEETCSPKKQGTSKNKKKNSKSANVETTSSNTTEKETLQKSKKSKKQKTVSKRKNDNNVMSTIILASSDSSDTITETHSKYKVSSKKSKIKEGQRSRPYISSDSDDSILEVPVPPKPAPPLINLQDSDDESREIENAPNSPTTSLISNHQLTTKNASETADSELLSISGADTDQTVSPTGALDIPESTFETTSCEISDDSQPIIQTVLNDTTLQINSTATLPSNAYLTPEEQPVMETEENNIILNCTGIQRGASSLEEIKKMSAAAESKQVSSDDSMTESEAANWGQLAQSRISLNESETAKSAERVSISENEITADNPRNVKHKKTKNKKSSDNSPKESHNATKEINISEFSGSVMFNFKEGSNNQEANSTDFAQALMEDPVVHPEPAEETSTEKNDPTKTHTKTSNKEKSPNKRKRLSDTIISPSTRSKQARLSDAEAGPSSVGLTTPKKKNVEKPRRRNCAADYFFLPMSDELKTFYNESWGGESFDIQQVQDDMPKDPRHWAILDSDLCNPSRRQRYWSNQKCKQCHSDGHDKASCPFPRKVPNCHMCGKEGHTEPRCPEKKCLTCGRTTSSYVKTCEYCRKLKCSTCGSKGHEKSMCPDLWRRFHKTTNTLTVNISEGNNTIMKPANQLHCCNCARRGHDYTDCVKYRWSQHFPTPSYVTNYTDGPHYINNAENEVIEITDESFVNENNDQNVDENIICEKETEPKKAARKKVPNHSENAQANIIYSYTSRHIITDPRVWKHKIRKIRKDVKCVEEAGPMPRFLEDIGDLVPLEFTVTSDEAPYLKFVGRCERKHFNDIRSILWMWGHRDDVDKNHIILKELPLQKSEMIHLLSNKLNEAKASVENPVELLTEIKSLKKQIMKFHRNGIRSTQSEIATTRLLKLESKLVISIKCQDSKGKFNTEKLLPVTNVIDNLRQIESKTVPIEIFLNIAKLCNKFFGQYVPYEAKELTKDGTSNSKKRKKKEKKGKKEKILRKNPERAARYNAVDSEKSALIPNKEPSSTDEKPCSVDTGNSSHTITSDTPVEAPSTCAAPTVAPNPSILDILAAAQMLLPLPPLLVNPCNVNFMSNNSFVRPDNVGQENFLPLSTARSVHTDNNNPYNVPLQNLNQAGPSTGISHFNGVQYQPFNTLGLPYESHSNNIQSTPQQFCYNNAPQDTIQMNQIHTGSSSHQDVIIDKVVRLDNNQLQDNVQSTQMQYQNPPTYVENTPNLQPMLKTKKERRRAKLERRRQNKLLQEQQNNKNPRNVKAIKKNARFAIQIAKNLNIPSLTAAADALSGKLKAGVITEKDTNSFNQLILKLSAPKNRDQKK